MDELEGIVEPRALTSGDYEEGDVRGAKRARIDAPAPGPAVGGAGAVEEVQRVEAPAPVPPTQPMGLLSANAIDSLKFMASLRQAAPAPAPKPAPAAAPSGLGSLADYGSDDDE